MPRWVFLQKWKRWKKRALATALALAFFSGTSNLYAYAMAPTMRIEDVTPGMEGTGYTVIGPSGQIEPFDVHIVGTVDEGQGGTKRIMAKASGPLIEETGGALQGMSGSPIYIDGQLVGALSAGIKDMDPHTILITPIGEMLPILKMPDSKGPKPLRAAQKMDAMQKTRSLKDALSKLAAGVNDLFPKNEATADAQDNQAEAKSTQEATKSSDDTALTDEAQKAANRGTDEANAKAEKAPEKAALFVSGFTNDAMHYLEKRLAPLGYVATNSDASFGRTPKAQGTLYGAELFPGSALGAAVTYGDFSIGATGTVTAVDGKKILAFGHPFLHKGNVNYFLTDAQVVGTVHGQSDGIKIANIGHIIGRINQDRDAGIAGVIGEFPAVVPMKVHVEDKTLGKKADYAASIAYDEDFLPILTSGIAYASWNKMADTMAGQTVSLGFTVHTDAVPSGKIERKNLYYAASDAGEGAVAELGQLVNILCQDADKDPDIIGIDVNITAESDRKTASLISAVPDKPLVKPGDTVLFRVALKPYRGAQETVTIPYQIPKNQPDGILPLDLRGGGFVPVTQTLLQGMVVSTTTGNAPANNADAATSAEESPAPKDTTAEQVQKFLAMGKNNEIIVAPTPLPAGVVREVGKMPAALSANNTKPLTEKKADLLGVNRAKQAAKGNPLEARIETPYVIENVIHTTLQVKGKA